MNRTARIQTWAGLATIVALPLLYLGATNELLPVTVLGLVVFTAGMLITPTLRFLPGPKEESSSRQAASRPRPAGRQRAAGQAGEESPAATHRPQQPREE